MTIDTRLAEIRARVEAATEGPWRASVVATYVDADGQRSGKGGVYPGGEQGSPPLFLTMGWLVTDAEFIAASRTDLPALLAAVETVRETCTLAIDEFEDPAYEANGYALGIVASSRTILHYLTAALGVQA